MRGNGTSWLLNWTSEKGLSNNVKRSFTTNFSRVNMGCLPASLQLTLQQLFNKTRCILACCGGQIIVQNSEFCDGKDPERYLLQSTKRRKFYWPRGCFPCCKRTRSQEDYSWTSKRVVEETRNLHASQTCATKIAYQQSDSGRKRRTISSWFSRFEFIESI